MAKVFGNISPKIKSKIVTTHVAIHIAALLHSAHNELAIPIAILVAKAAVNVLTKLFQINIVISNLSVLDFNFFSSFAQNFFCFKKASTLCSGTDIKAVSDPEKKADKKNKTMKISIATGSIRY